MKRNNLINIHLYCASLSSVVLFVLAITGGLYLLGYKGAETRTTVETISTSNFLSKKDVKSNIDNYLRDKDKDYSFEYVKSYKGYSITRPTTKDYYRFEEGPEGTIVVSKVVPNLHKRLVEFHKGHGRKYTKWVNSFFALCLSITVISGLWLGLKNKRIRTATIATALISLLIFIIEFYS